MRKFSTLGRLTILLLAAACGNNGTGNIPRRDTAAVDSPAGAVAVPIAPATSAARAGARSIIFFGNSLTAGYGVNPSEAFPALIQDRIDAVLRGFVVPSPAALASGWHPTTGAQVAVIG